MRPPKNMSSKPRARRRRIATLSLFVCCASLMLGTGVAEAIVSGQPDTEHPNVGLVRVTKVDDATTDDRWRCTGTLIADRVVLTAGHCLLGPNGPATQVYVTFNPSLVADPVVDPSAADEYLTGTAYPDPRWDGGVGFGNGVGQQPTKENDRGVIVLDGSAKAKWGIDPAPLPPLGFLDANRNKLKKRTYTVVGYGLGKYLGNFEWVVNQERRFTTASYTSLTPTDVTFSINANDANAGSGTCFGDSGGPVFLDSLPYVLGDLSWVESLKCTAHTTYGRTDTKGARAFLGQFVTLP